MKSQQRSLFALVLTCLLCFLPAKAFAQNGQIQGCVTDASSGDPIPGVFVIVRGTDNGVSTDNEGRYTLSLRGLDNPVLVLVVWAIRPRNSLSGSAAQSMFL